MSDPFEELSSVDQQCAIDVAVAVAILSARVPAVANGPFYQWITKEFATAYSLPPNIARYALRHVGTALFNNDWIFSADKVDQKFITRFRQVTDAGRDGEKEGA